MVNCLVQLIGTCSNCARVAYNSQFAESKLDRVTGGFCGILLNRLITVRSIAQYFLFLALDLYNTP